MERVDWLNLALEKDMRWVIMNTLYKIRGIYFLDMDLLYSQQRLGFKGLFIYLFIYLLI